MARHIPALDGLRGLAVMLVVVHHAIGITPMSGQVESLLTPWFSAGWIGVDLFFVLSGFLITGILLETRNRLGYYRNFFVRRALRILPLYYVVLTMLVLVIAPGVLHGRQLFYWLQMSNLSTALGWTGDQRFNIQWSLAIEEQFYLVWPVAVMLLVRKRLLTLCLVLIVAAPLLRTAMLLLGAPSVAVYVLTWCRMDALAAGALVALLARAPNGLAPFSRLACWMAIGGGAVLLALGLTGSGLEYYASPVQSVGYSALAVTFGALLILLLTGSPAGVLVRAFNAAPLRALGTVSYAIYLFHPIVREALARWVYGPTRWILVAGSQLPSALLFVGLVLATTYVAAWLSWHVLEKHCLALKRYFESATPERPRESGIPNGLVASNAERSVKPAA